MRIDKDKFKELCARRKEVELHLPLLKTDFKEMLILGDILLTQRELSRHQTLEQTPLEVPV